MLPRILRRMLLRLGYTAGAGGSRFSSRPSSARSSISSVRSVESVKSRESARAAAIDIGAGFTGGTVEALQLVAHTPI